MHDAGAQGMADLHRTSGICGKLYDPAAALGRMHACRFAGRSEAMRSPPDGLKPISGTPMPAAAEPQPELKLWFASAGKPLFAASGAVPAAQPLAKHIAKIGDFRSGLLLVVSH